jgi:hypothetical protein
VKAVMKERGAGYADVAAAVGRSAVAVKISINSRKPAPRSVRGRLQQWLDQAPAVASPVPFRSNGHDHPDSAYGSTSADGRASAA